MTHTEVIKQTDAIMALEGFQKTALSKTIDDAVISGLVTNSQAADEMVAYAKTHKSLDGFLESRTWLKNA